MKVDYIIVGLGLAGLAFSKELMKNNKSFIVYENNSQNSSIVAGGVYNPVILKRFTPVWEAAQQLETALPFYAEIEQQFNKKYDYKLDVLRVFKSVEEQNNWFVACDHPQLSNYMVSKMNFNKYNGVNADFGFGKLVKTGRIDTKSLINDFRTYLKKKEILKIESFNYTQLTEIENGFEYCGITTSKIIFCEGFGLKNNPYFNYLPMQEAKGELLIIHAPELEIDFLLKAAIFILPLGNSYYKVGATFNWKDKTLDPTKEGRDELVEKLNSAISVPYTIVEQVAGIRPTVKDRRPLVGCHPENNRMAILNGLGTRGVMIAPTAAKQLFQLLENDVAVNPEYSIGRFDFK